MKRPAVPLPADPDHEWLDVRTDSTPAPIAARAYLHNDDWLEDAVADVKLRRQARRKTNPLRRPLFWVATVFLSVDIVLIVSAVIRSQP